MNIKKSILTCLLMLGFVSASAQQQQDEPFYDFNPHWYVQVQPLGGQYTLGELPFGDMFSYNAQLALGYQFDEVLGARLSVNAWQSKGGSDYGALGKWDWKWKYVAPSLDLTADLSTLFCGFNPNRLFTLNLFLGIGANIGFDNDAAAAAKNQIDPIHQWNALYYRTDNAPMSLLWDGTKTRLVGRAGLGADFRLSDAVSLGLEVNANTLSDGYNSKEAKNNDWYFNALLGLKINLGNAYTVYPAGSQFTPRRSLLRKAPRVIEKEVIKEKEVEKIVEKTVYVDKPIYIEKPLEPLRRDIFFTINSSRIDPSEDKKLDEIASYLKLYPQTKVSVTGYADKGTGNAQINKRLGERRARVVADRLVKQYRVDRSQIVVDSKGDTEQPFAENDKNRVSICIAE
ncbi:MAG: OmpA family protein [Prevotella sp.]|nr:OmpA family protein [Prevotella sp.]